MNAVPGLLLLGVIGSLVYLRRFITPTHVFCVGLAAQPISGNAEYVGLPISPDRVLFLVAFGWVLLQNRDVIAVIGARPLHLLMGSVLIFAAVSGVVAGTITMQDGFFAWLDRIGLVPFASYLLAPIFFRRREQYALFLTTLAIIGAYLSIVAVAEVRHDWWLVIPSYISDPAVGIHFGRARGPFLDTTANGLTLLAGAAAAFALYFSVVRTQSGRLLTLLVSIACLVGAILTLTRSIWLGGILGIGVAIAFSPATRKYFVPALVAIALAVIVSLVAVPGLSSQVADRRTSQEPLWDRLNTNTAAMRAIQAEPLFGIGLQRFVRDSDIYLSQSDQQPLTGSGIEVHNVFLSRFAELGLVGGSLWLSAFVACIGRALVPSQARRYQETQQNFVGFAVAWITVAIFAPNSGALPTMILWTWAGILAAPMLGKSRGPEADAANYVPVPSAGRIHA